MSRENSIELFREHHHVVVGYLRNQFKGLNAQEAEDAVQEAWRLFLRYGCKHENVRGWLIVVARRELRKIEQKRGLVGIEEVAEPTVNDRAVETLSLLNSLSSLKPQQKFVLGHIVSGYEYRDIAERAGFTYAWVNRHAVEGRRALRELVEA